MASYHSEFKTTSLRIAEDKVYRVYRIIDIRKPDAPGNREYRQGIFTTLQEAEEAADYWNKKEE